jgi:thiamine pyrophosphate-dependent acetolactate synthase large subunit-like protein
MTDNISSGTVVQTKDQIEKALDKQFEERGTVVLDTELEMGGNMLPKEQKEESNK